MNFRKISKRPLTPRPFFGKKCCDFFRKFIQTQKRPASLKCRATSIAEKFNPRLDLANLKLIALICYMLWLHWWYLKFWQTQILHAARWDYGDGADYMAMRVTMILKLVTNFFKLTLQLHPLNRWSDCVAHPKWVSFKTSAAMCSNHVWNKPMKRLFGWY